MNSRHIRFALAAATVATLAACGGGGDDGGTPAAADPIDKYMGTIVEQICFKATNAVSASTGAPLYRKNTYSDPIKISPKKMQYTVKIDLFTDSECGGAPLASINLMGADNTRSVDGTKVIGGTTVDEVTGSEGVNFPDVAYIGAPSITVNGVTYTGAPFTNAKPRTFKDVWYLDSNNAIYSGDFSVAVDAQGYPNALLAKPTWMKK